MLNIFERGGNDIDAYLIDFLRIMVINLQYPAQD